MWTAKVVLNGHGIPLYKCLNDPTWLCECVSGYLGQVSFCVLDSSVCHKCLSEQGGDYSAFPFNI